MHIRPLARFVVALGFLIALAVGFLFLHDFWATVETTAESPQARHPGRDRAAGVVLGTLEACRPLDGVSPLDVVAELFADAPYPVALGLQAGHANAESDVENLALPFGVEVELDAGAGRLVACEAAVV
jgi:hypothetical protein